VTDTKTCSVGHLLWYY